MMLVGDLLITQVGVPAEGVVLSSLLVRPDTTKQLPAVIIIHEWWGLNDHIKDIAQRFAREGYVALAPDLYSRLGHHATTDPNEAARLMESLQSQAALKDLNATTRYLKQQPFVDAWKIGMVGFCMGGTFTLMAATHNSDVKAAVPFYGQIPPSDTFRYFLCPILYIYGEQDGWIKQQDVERLRQGLKQLGKPGEVRTYPGCPHAFFNDTRPDVYRPREAQDAWQRTLAFLRTSL